MKRFIISAISGLALAACATAPAETLATDTDAAELSEKMADHPLSFMFGEWVGTASGFTPDRQPYEVTQTERVGPLLGGDVVAIEGRGYGADGSTAFNAFAVVSPTGENGAWEMRSYTMGRAGTFPFEPRANGFVWSTPAGPNARMRYTATFEGDSWSQIGEFVADGQPARQVFKMDLTRTGPSSWPAAGAVSPNL